MVAEDGGGLEFPAYAQPVNLVFIELEEIVIRVPFEVAAVRTCASRDDVEKGRFPGSVRPDDRAELPFRQVEIEIVDRLESVERFVETLGGEKEWFLFHGSVTSASCLVVTGCLEFAPLFFIFAIKALTCAGMPMMPLGMNMTTSTKEPPRIRSHISG